MKIISENNSIFDGFGVCDIFYLLWITINIWGKDAVDLGHHLNQKFIWKMFDTQGIGSFSHF